MSATTKLIGVIAGLSAVAVIGVAVAQGVPPNPYVANPALGAGQQSSHMTSMGETGVPGLTDTIRTATVVRTQEVAVVRVPEAAPVVMAAPAPAPAPMVIAQVETAPAATMGAAPEPMRPAAPMRRARRDRN